MKNKIITTCEIFLVFWVVQTIAWAILGLMQQNITTCDQQISRIEYVLPGWEIGCWLGEKIE